MLRTALAPRWLAWLVVVIGVGFGFVRLGMWQMNVAREDSAQEVLREAASRPVLELTATLAPHAPFPRDGSNQRVRAIGRFEPERQVLVPELRAGDIVILDNLPGHKGEEAAELVEACGARFLFLPSYSPDLNPIEMAFSKLKTLLRKAERRTRETLWQMIGQLLSAFTPDECINYIRHAGYAS